MIARRLGHSSVKTVLVVYGHLIDGIDQEAARRLDQRVLESGAVQMRAKPKAEKPDADASGLKCD